ncbi:YegP family protein [Roseibacillus ishigakijimensis]|uniref:YegP family protein n=1 Tax=Roseibacillus ishigakijimensis TaxID=454146 RepID=A0A934VGQ7_9BACT|nr:YegP family protein [Roseibacillus ishigakijimensis]MBK1833118.1 YegP family protein [Roseibacillus ishigakijimensis]
MFEVFQSENSEKYYFRLKAGNGETILQSQAYKDKASALKGVESVKKNGTSEENFEIREAANGKGYFVLKAGNGQIIGQSQQYKSESGLQNGIQSTMKNAAGEIKDLTA